MFSNGNRSTDGYVDSPEAKFVYVICICEISIYMEVHTHIFIFIYIYISIHITCLKYVSTSGGLSWRTGHELQLGTGCQGVASAWFSRAFANLIVAKLLGIFILWVIIQGGAP